MDDDLTHTLTFQEKLIRRAKPEPLGGHHVVVLERRGDEGDQHHSVLEPGDELPRRSRIDMLLRKPDVYFAFAVDATKSRRLNFFEQVEMAERGREFELHFSLRYTVTDPELLVSRRAIDPLECVRGRVAEVVTEEVAELRWIEVWESFRAESEHVVSSTIHELRSFARDYGIGIDELRLRPKFAKSTLAPVEEIHTVQAQAQVERARIDAEYDAESYRRELRRNGAVDEDEDRADAARKRAQDAVVDKLLEWIAGAGNPIDLEQLQDFMARGGLMPLLGGGSHNGSGAIGPGQPSRSLAAAGDELGPVLSELVGLTERFGVLPQRRKLRGELLHLLAAAVADDSGQVSPEEHRWARSARALIATAQLPLTQAEALRNLADPNQLRGRFSP